MDKMPSTIFRNSYSSLTRPTVVTVNGRPIGTWNPGPWGTLGALVEPIETKEELRASDEEIAAQKKDPLRMTQAERDAVLRRINKRG